MQNRHTIRKHIRQQRFALSSSLQQSHAAHACQLLIHQPVFSKAQHIAFYLPVGGEIDPHPIIDAALQQQKSCYLPVLHPTQHNTLFFLPYEVTTSLQKNQFGILEPAIICEKITFAWHLDLVLTPLVAFDRQGNRLGMGKGYYDRTFQFLSTQVPRQTRLLGLAHAFQEISCIEANSWDIALDGILTEKELIYPLFV